MVLLFENARRQLFKKLLHAAADGQRGCLPSISTILLQCCTHSQGHFIYLSSLTIQTSPFLENDVVVLVQYARKFLEMHEIATNNVAAIETRMFNEISRTECLLRLTSLVVDQSLKYVLMLVLASIK